jgi:hypothetical protein
MCKLGTWTILSAYQISVNATAEAAAAAPMVYSLKDRGVQQYEASLLSWSAARASTMGLPTLHRIEHRVGHGSLLLLLLPFAALVKLKRNVALVLEVYLAGASVNVILCVWTSCSKSGITTTNKSKARNLPMRTWSSLQEEEVPMHDSW